MLLLDKLFSWAWDEVKFFTKMFTIIAGLLLFALLLAGAACSLSSWLFGEPF